MPNPRKPHRLKVVQGTARKDRPDPTTVDVPPLDSIPQPPDWLPNCHALKEWNRLAAILTATKLLTDADLTTLAHMCALHGKIVQLYAAGAVPTAATIATLRVMQGDFGLSPVARGKVNPVGTGETGNKFETNGKRPAKPKKRR